MKALIDRSRPVLCFVHDAKSPHPPQGLLEIEDDVWAQVDLLQVRGKDLSAGELEELARVWIARLAGLPTRIVVNDRLDVALAAGADGVHLGQEDLPLDQARRLAPAGFLLGASTHSHGELLAGQRSGADYAGLGAFFGTGTKPGARLLQPAEAGLLTPVPGLEIPVLAIGGITPAGVKEVLRLPAVTGVAASGAIQEASQPGRVIRDLYAALHAAWEELRGVPTP